MSFIKNVIIDKTEESIKFLRMDKSADKLIIEEIELDKLFDKIQEFIMESHFDLSESSMNLANAYKRSLNANALHINLID